MTSDEQFMREALRLAREGASGEEVPVGAVVVVEGEIAGRGFNSPAGRNDPTAHAEILAIRQAAAALHDWRLEDCVLAVTLEPCPMCAGAIVNARIPTLIYGCDDPKAGAVRTLYRLCEDPRFNHRVEVRGGVLAEECAQMLRSFFEAKRAMGKK